MNVIDITNCNTPDSAADYKGMNAVLTMTDGSTLEGGFLSVNSKGWNIIDHTNGKTISRGFARVAKVEVVDNTNDMIADAIMEAEINNDQDIFEDAAEISIAEMDDTTADDDAPGSEMDELVAQLDGATTAELADMFGIAAKELRVTLRALGMGVGKGHRYHLNADQINTVKAALTA